MLDAELHRRVFKKESFDTMMNNLENLLTTDYFSNSTGISRWDIVKNKIAEVQADHPSLSKPISVIKHLDSEHKERFIVKNFVQDKTFSQKLFRDKLATEYPDIDLNELPQVFVVDAWRVEKLAEAVSTHEAALRIGMAYQEAALATLTDGTLRMFVVT